MASKLRNAPADLLAQLKADGVVRDGMTVMAGGFGLCGNAEVLIDGVRDKGVKDITLISNNAGAMGKFLANWLTEGLIRRVICSYVGTNQDLHQRMAEGTVDVQIVPQGTLTERMRAAGAGIPAFFTPTGAGTVVAEGKETRVFNGREHILEGARRCLYVIR